MIRQLLTGLLVVAAPASAQLTSTQQARIDSIFSAFNNTTPGCVLGVGQNGKTLYEKAYGMANLEYDIPLTTSSVMESGSVAKQFTASAVNLLAERGVLSWDDDVRKWIPEVPTFGGKKITLRMLANHTSGIRDQWGLLGLQNSPPGSAVHSLDLIVDLVSKQKDLNFEPNTQYLYSNTGYALLAVVVQRASGKSLADFSRENLFGPLGMTHTQWRYPYNVVVKGRATAYEGGAGGTFVQDMPFTNVYGNGGLLFTVGDALIFWDALLNNRLGSPKFTETLTTPAVFNSGKQHTYALGVTNSVVRGVRAYSHSGSTAGYRTYLVAFPETKTVIATFCNNGMANPVAYGQRVALIVLEDKFGPAQPSSVKSSGISAAELSGLAGRYHDLITEDVVSLDVDGETLKRGQFVLADAKVRRENGKIYIEYPGSDAEMMVLEKFETVTNPPLADYVGTYRSPEVDVTFDIVNRDNKLVVKRRLQQPVTLVPQFADGFNGGGLWQFTRDKNGKVNAVLYSQGRVRRVRFERVK